MPEWRLGGLDNIGQANERKRKEGRRSAVPREPYVISQFELRGSWLGSRIYPDQ